MKPINTAEVNIFNQTLKLTSEINNPEKLKEIAKFVDYKMREIFELTQISSTTKIALLVSLNLAEELLNIKGESLQDHHSQLTEILNQVERISNKISSENKSYRDLDY